MFDLLRLTLDYPMLRSDKWIKTQLDKTEDDEDKLRYCSYASISLNIVETAIDKYKTDLSKTHFWPAIEMLLVRHESYYQGNKDAYKPLAALYEKI